MPHGIDARDKGAMAKGERAGIVERTSEERRRSAYCKKSDAELLGAALIEVTERYPRSAIQKKGLFPLASDEDRAMLAAFLESDAAVIRHDVRRLATCGTGGVQ